MAERCNWFPAAPALPPPAVGCQPGQRRGADTLGVSIPLLHTVLARSLTPPSVCPRARPHPQPRGSAARHLERAATAAADGAHACAAAGRGVQGRVRRQPGRAHALCRSPVDQHRGKKGQTDERDGRARSGSCPVVTRSACTVPAAACPGQRADVGGHGHLHCGGDYRDRSGLPDTPSCSAPCALRPAPCALCPVPCALCPGRNGKNEENAGAGEASEERYRQRAQSTGHRAQGTLSLPTEGSSANRRASDQHRLGGEVHIQRGRWVRSCWPGQPANRRGPDQRLVRAPTRRSPPSIPFHIAQSAPCVNTAGPATPRGGACNMRRATMPVRLTFSSRPLRRPPPPAVTGRRSQCRRRPTRRRPRSGARLRCCRSVPGS